MELRRRTALARVKIRAAGWARPKTCSPGETYFTRTKVGWSKAGAAALFNREKTGGGVPRARMRTVSQWRFEGLAEASLSVWRPR